MNVKSRLVAKHVNTGKEQGLFAVAFAKQLYQRTGQRVLMFNDIAERTCTHEQPV